MLRKIAIAILLVTPMLAARADAASFTNGSLTGTYIINVAGFAHNDGSDDISEGGAPHGRLTLTGLVTLNAGDVLGGDLNLAYGENSVNSAYAFNQLSCKPNLVGGAYYIKPDGAGYLTLAFNASETGEPCLRGGAVLELDIALSHSLGGTHQLGLDDFSSEFNQHCNNELGTDLEMDNGTGDRICISDLSLSGKLVHQ